MTQRSTTLQILCQLLAAAWDVRRPDSLESIPWSDVVDLAQSHGVSPHLRDILQDMGQVIPPEIQLRLDRDFFRTAKDKALRFHELKQILEAFSGAGVPTLLLKGAALVSTVYGNSALRPMLDLDLLISPASVATCKAILNQRGYVPAKQHQTALGYHDHGEQAFVSDEPTRPVIDLHWHLFTIPYYMHRIPADWPWANSQPHDIDGLRVQVLNPEASLLYLSSHLSLHHRLEGLLWFIDLAWLVHQCRARLDWEKIITDAQTFRLLLPLRETLDRLAFYWPTLPLDEPRHRLHALKPTRFERALFRLRMAEPPNPLLRNYVYVVGLPDMLARLRFVLLNALPPPDYMIERYGIKGVWRLPYWYLYRWGDGLVKLIRTTPQALRLGRVH